MFQYQSLMINTLSILNIVVNGIKQIMYPDIEADNWSWKLFAISCLLRYNVNCQ